MDITNAHRTKIRSMYSWCDDSMLISFFEGKMGKGYCDDLNNATWAAVVTGDFCFLAGKPCNNIEIGEIIKAIGSQVCVVVQSLEWLDFLNEVGCNLHKQKRFHMSLNENSLNLEILVKYQSEICKIKGGTLEVVGEKEYNQLRVCNWENAFVSNFKDYQDFKTNGLGFVVKIDGEIAAGATSFGYYSKGFELQIATNPKFRKMGLATICSAAFLLECVKMGKRPHWDAANMISVNIAQKMGFVFDGEYYGLYLNENN